MGVIVQVCSSIFFPMVVHFQFLKEDRGFKILGDLLLFVFVFAFVGDLWRPDNNASGAKTERLVPFSAEKIIFLALKIWIFFHLGIRVRSKVDSFENYY